jgi:hypothetical protein
MTDANTKLTDLRVGDLSDALEYAYGADEYVNTSCCAVGDKVYWFGTMRSGGVYMMVIEGDEVIHEKLIAE